MRESKTIVSYRDKTEKIPCPFGDTVRIVTGGETSICNVHVVSVTDGNPHIHKGYNETYYVLSGKGTLTLDKENYDLRPGAVAVIPAGVLHSVVSTTEKSLEFIIFGTPGMSVADPGFIPETLKSE
ncbi:MAG: cupin domain-containing protein [Verrucomicrobiota bacterium]|nr:cupin domain-containing protein [Verrucomicrobiota bacterium]